MAHVTGIPTLSDTLPELEELLADAGLVAEGLAGIRARADDLAVETAWTSSAMAAFRRRLAGWRVELDRAVEAVEIVRREAAALCVAARAGRG